MTLNERDDRSIRLVGASDSGFRTGRELVEQDRSSFRRFVGRSSISSSAASFARAAASY